MKNTGNFNSLAPMEPRLRWIVILRFAALLWIPLVIAFFFDSIIVKAVFWVISVWILWSFVSGWGDTGLAVAVVLVPLYIFFELDGSPKWLAYLVALLAFLQIGYINKRIKQMELLRHLDEP